MKAKQRKPHGRRQRKLLLLQGRPLALASVPTNGCKVSTQQQRQEATAQRQQTSAAI